MSEASEVNEVNEELRAAFELLGLEPTRDRAQLKTAYRSRVTRAHPDHGGTVEAFNALQDAFAKADAYASAPVPCADCAGTGQVTVARGFTVGKFSCTRCGGTGEADDSAN